MSQGSLGSRIKDPADVRTYAVDWSAWLTSQSSDTISSSSWSAATGITVVTSANTTTTATAKLSGGVEGRSYVISNTIITAAGQTRKVSFLLQIESQ